MREAVGGGWRIGGRRGEKPVGPELPHLRDGEMARWVQHMLCVLGTWLPSPVLHMVPPAPPEVTPKHQGGNSL